MSESPEKPALVGAVDEAAMNATREIVAVRRWPDALRWGGCLALALGIHAAGAAVLLGWGEAPDSVANAPLIMIELAPLPVAPESKPTEIPPGPQQMQAEPESRPEKPIEKVEAPVVPQAELQSSPPPKPLEKPKENKSKQRHASLASAPSPAEIKAARVAAPMPGASSRNHDAVPNWKSQLVARLERYKRAPPEAPNVTGTATLAFNVDRDGGVHNARIVRSSGTSVIDRETLSLVQRAAPMPPPPPEISGAQIAIVVPIRYNMR